MNTPTRKGRKRQGESDTLFSSDEISVCLSLASRAYPRLSSVTAEELKAIQVSTPDALEKRLAAPLHGHLHCYTSENVTNGKFLRHLLFDKKGGDYPQYKNIAFKSWKDAKAIIKDPTHVYHVQGIEMDPENPLTKQSSFLINRGAQEVLRTKDAIFPSQSFMDPKKIISPGLNTLHAFAKPSAGTFGYFHWEDTLFGALNILLNGTQLWVIIHEESYQAYINLLLGKYSTSNPCSNLVYMLTIPELKAANISFEVVLQTPGTLVVTRSREAHTILALTDDVMVYATNFEDGYPPWNELTAPGKTVTADLQKVFALGKEDFELKFNQKDTTDMAFPLALAAYQLVQANKLQFSTVGKFIFDYYADDFVILLQVLSEQIQCGLKQAPVPYIANVCDFKKLKCLRIMNFVSIKCSDGHISCSTCWLEFAHLKTTATCMVVALSVPELGHLSKLLQAYK